MNWPARFLTIYWRHSETARQALDQLLDRPLSDIKLTCELCGAWARGEIVERLWICTKCSASFSHTEEDVDRTVEAAQK